MSFNRGKCMHHALGKGIVYAFLSASLGLSINIQTAAQSQSDKKNILIENSCDAPEKLHNNRTLSPAPRSTSQPPYPNLAGWVNFPGYHSNLKNRVIPSTIFEKTSEQRKNVLLQDPNIKKVIIPNPAFSDFSTLASLPKLEHLEINLRFIDQHALRQLRRSSSLRRLIIRTGFSPTHPLPSSLDLPNVELIELNIISDFMAWEESDNYAEKLPINALSVPKDSNIVCLRLVGDSVTNCKSLKDMKGLKYLQLNVHELKARSYKAVEALSLCELGLFADKLNTHEFIKSLSTCSANSISVSNPSTDVVMALSRKANPISIAAIRGYIDTPVIVSNSSEKKLQLFGQNKQNDSNLVNLLLSNPQTECVDLPVCRGSVNTMLEAVHKATPNLPKLAKLTGLFSYPFGLDDDQANWIAKYPHLKEVDFLLPETNASDTLRLLRPLHDLETVNVSESDFADDSVSDLLRFPNLHVFSGRASKLTSSALPTISKLPLRKLDLSFTKISDEHSSSWADMKELRHLDLSFTSIGDKTLESLQQLTNLEDLNLSHTQITGKGVGFLKSLKHLKSLNLEATKVSGWDPVVFREMPDLSQHNLKNADLQSSDIEAVIDSAAREIDLSFTWIGVQAITRLTKMKNLQKAYLTDISSLAQARLLGPVQVIDARGELNYSDKCASMFKGNSMRADVAEMWKNWKEKNWHQLQELNKEEKAAEVRDFHRTVPYFCATGRMIAIQEKKQRSLFRGIGNLGAADFERAKKDFDLYLSLGGAGSSLVHAYRGLAFMRIGDLEKAKVDLDRAILWDPDFPDPYAFRSELSERLGNFQQAKKDKDIAYSGEFV